MRYTAVNKKETILVFRKSICRNRCYSHIVGCIVHNIHTVGGGGEEPRVCTTEARQLNVLNVHPGVVVWRPGHQHFPGSW